MLRVGTVGTSSIMRTIQEAIRLTDGMECRVAVCQYYNSQSE